MANSIPSAANPTPTWINITGNIHDLAYSIFGQAYNPTTDPNSITLNQAVQLTSVVADWEYTIPNAATDPPVQGSTRCCSSPAIRASTMSLDNGLTWTLFPDTTLGAVAEGGNLPHVDVTDLSLSIGNINSNTGMPNLAGPYEPSLPRPPRTPTSSWLRPSAAEHSPSTWRRSCSPTPSRLIRHSGTARGRR